MDDRAFARVGVIGAGQMGNGIAHVCALAGYPGRAQRRVAPTASRPALATINGNMARQVGKQAHQRGATARRRSRASSRPRATTRLSDCDLVIEAATEKEDVKRKIFTELCPSLKPEAHRRHQHLVDLDHAARVLDRPAGEDSSASIS